MKITLTPEALQTETNVGGASHVLSHHFNKDNDTATHNVVFVVLSNFTPHRPAHMPHMLPHNDYYDSTLRQILHLTFDNSIRAIYSP